MKYTRRSLSLVLALTIMISLFAGFSSVSANAASTPQFTVNKVTELSYTNVKISAKITNPARTKITKVGFQLGTASNKLNTNKYDTVSMTSSYVNASYLMSKYKVTLTPNTTYYYRFYIVTGGKTYCGSVNSFKTPNNAPVFTINNPSVSSTNATVSASVTNPTRGKITRVGFQIGTASNALNTNKYDNVNITDAKVNASYSMNKYGVTMKAGQKYFYRFYIIINGKTTCSSIKDFTIPKSTASAPSTVKYTAIKALPVSRIVQPANDKSGSCNLSSIATLITYKNNIARVGGRDYTQGCAVYKQVYKKNGNTTYLYDSTGSYYGLKKVSGGSLQTIYNNLKSGKPVVIYTGNHASLVIGYKGNSNTLSTSDFIVMEIKDGCYDNKGKLYDKGRWDNSVANYNKANTPSNSYLSSSTCYVTMSSWMSKNGSIKNMWVY